MPVPSSPARAASASTDAPSTDAASADAASTGAASAQPWSVEVVRSCRELDAVWAQWQALDRATRWALGGPDWSRAWIESELKPADEAGAGDGDRLDRGGGGREERLRVVLVRRGGALVALAPVVRGPRRGDPFTLPGAQVGDPVDCGCVGESAADPLARAIASLMIAIQIPRLPADGPLLPALRRAYRRGRGLLITRPAPGSPGIDLDPGWIEPERKLSSRRRSDLRRARRRADQAGGITVALTAPGPAEFGADYADALRVEAGGWKGRSGTALAAGDAQALVLRRYLAAAAASGQLRIAWLRIGGVVAAVQLAIESGGRFRLLKVGYDERFARCSPGHLLLLESIRAAAQRDLRSYELLGHPEPWTRAWTTHERPCVSVRAFPSRPGGIAALAAAGATHLGARVRWLRARP